MDGFLIQFGVEVWQITDSVIHHELDITRRQRGRRIEKSRAQGIGPETS